MFNESMELLIVVHVGPGIDEETLDELTRQLCEALAALDELLADIPSNNDLPEGAMGLSVSIGSILVKVLEAGGVTGLITILNSWLSRDERRSVTLHIGNNKLEVTNISAEDQTNLIQWFKLQSSLKIDA